MTPTIKPRTKILFACVPADGHFNPLTGLAHYLKTIGCDVRWYTSTYYQPKIEQLGIPFYPLRRALDISAKTNPDELFPGRNKIKSQVAKLKFDMIEVFIKRGPEYYDDICDIRRDFPFELMVADITFGAIPMVAEHMGIPSVGVDIIPLPETSKDLPPAGLGLTPSYSFFGRMKQNLMRFFADKVLFAAPTNYMIDVLKGYGISAKGSNIFDLGVKKSTIVLQSGTPGFEYKRSDMSSHVHFVGPLLPHKKTKTTQPWYDARLSSYQKVVLVTQGTVEKDVNKLIIPTLEAFKNTDTLVVVTTGGSQTAELRQSYPQRNIIIEDFIAFDEIMPYADVYVTNGGYGGVLLSIQNRLPMVAAGVHEGKNEICARVGYFGLGVNLKTEKPSADQIRQAVNRVLNDVSFKKNVNQLADEFAGYDTFTLATRHMASLLKPAVHKRVTVSEEASIY